MKTIFVQFFVCTSILFSQDTLLLQYPKKDGYNFSFIKPVSSDTIIALMTDGKFGASTDKGFHWTISTIDTIPPERIAYVDRNNIYAASGRTEKIIIYHSSDFGKSWRRITELKNKRQSGNIYQFDFAKPDFGYFSTYDLSGFTKGLPLQWRTLGIPIGMQFKQGIGWLYTGLNLFRTDDWGRSWRKLIHLKIGQGMNYTLIDSLIGFYQSDTLFKTTDGGKSWIKLKSPGTGMLNIVTERTWYYENLNNIYPMYLSTDSGNNWNKIGENVRLDFLDDDIGYLWDYLGLFARTSNKGVSWDTIFTRLPLVAHCGQIHVSPNGVGIAGKGNFGRQKFFLSTTNFGDEWHPVYTTESATPYLFNFSQGSFGNNDIFAYGIGIDSLRNIYTIVKTEDGGLHWQYQSDLYSFNQYYPKEKPKIIQTISENSIAIVTDSMQIFLSTNRGASWKVKHFTTSKPFLVYMLSVYFIDNLTGFVSTMNELFRTTDGGVTWQSFEYDSMMNPAMTFGLNDLFFQDANTGFACTNTSRTTIQKTTDGGATWSMIKELPISYYGKLSFRDTKHGLWFLNARNRGVSTAFITIDSGKTWKEYPFRGDDDFQDINLLNDTTFWVGNIPGGVLYDAYQVPGFIKRGIVHKNMTYVNRQKNPIIPTLLAVYPNPVRPYESLTIPFQVSDYIEINLGALSVFDVLGRKLNINPTLLRGKEESQFILNGRSLSPCLYFFRIDMKEKSQRRILSGKFIVAGG